MYKVILVNRAAPAREFGCLSDESGNDIEFDNVEAAKAAIEEEKGKMTPDEYLQVGFRVEDKDGNIVR